MTTNETPLFIEDDFLSQWSGIRPLGIPLGYDTNATGYPDIKDTKQKHLDKNVQSQFYDVSPVDLVGR